MAPAFPSLPMTFACGKTDYSSKVVSVSFSESLYRPFTLRVTLQLGEKDPKTLHDKYFKLTLLDAPTLSSHKKHFTLLGETEIIGKVTQERRVWKRGPSGVANIQTHLLIESPLAMLRNGQTFQIFYKKKLEDIFKTVWTPHQAHAKGDSQTISPAFKKLPKYTPEYLVQYKESDLQFLLRLCQEHGVGFTQVGKDLKFIPGDELGSGSQKEISYDGFTSWERCDTQLSREITSRNLKPGEPFEKAFESKKSFGKYKKAGHQVETFLDEKSGVGMSDVHVQVFQESLVTQEQGYILRAEHTWEERAGVFSPAVGLRAGDLVKGPPDEAENETFLIEEVSFEFHTDKESQSYDLSATLRSTETPYAPPRLHQTPREHGILRAQVIGPRSKSNVDDEAKLGRVKVLFLWDGTDESDRSSRTCWVRLLTPYMGKKHGTYIMPEVGDEVLVAFEGGDMHRPVVIGSVPDRNAELLKELTKDPALQLETLAFNTPKGIKARIWEKEGKEVSEQKVTLDVIDTIGLELFSHDKKQTGSMHLAEKIKVDMVSDDKKQTHDFNIDNKIKVNLLSENAKQTGKVNLADKIKIDLVSDGDVDAKLTSEGTAQTIAKKTITIKSEEKIELICGDAKITLEKNGNITVQGKELSFKGDNIASSATKDIKGSANNITHAAKTNHKMSGMNVTVSANQNATMSAKMNAKVEGKVNASLEGSVAAKVAGKATAEISASGITTVKGGLVKIN